MDDVEARELALPGFGPSDGLTRRQPFTVTRTTGETPVANG